MKNTHIKAGQEVPIELRKEIYREALEIIEKRKDEDSDNFGLCFFLLMVLYGTEKPEQVYRHPTDNENLEWRHTYLMFPELQTFLSGGFYCQRTNNQRIEFLKSVI